MPETAVSTISLNAYTQEAIWDELGKSMGMGDRIFARFDGSVIHPDSLSKACVRLAKQAGLGGIHLHTLRHTLASMLIQQGENTKSISERLGHSSTAFTNDVYGHLMLGMEEATAAKVNAALEGVIIGPARPLS